MDRILPPYPWAHPTPGLCFGEANEALGEKAVPSCREALAQVSLLTIITRDFPIRSQKLVARAMETSQELLYLPCLAREVANPLFCSACPQQGLCSRPSEGPWVVVWAQTPVQIWRQRDDTSMTHGTTSPFRLPRSPAHRQILALL